MKFGSSCLNMLLKCFEFFIVIFVAVDVRPSQVKIKSIKLTEHIHTLHMWECIHRLEPRFTWVR